MTAHAAPSSSAGAAESGRLWQLALIASFALLVVVAAIAAISPMAGEDYGLARPLDHLTDSSALAWILDRSARQILGWNARLGEQLIIVWLALGKPACAVANTAGFAAFALLLTWYGRGAVIVDRSLAVSFAIAASACLLLWPRLEIFFWETAAAAYLEPIVLTLVVLLPFFLADVRRRVSASWPTLALFLVLALLAGAAFENLGVAVLLTMVGAIVGIWPSDRPAARRLVFVAASFAIGWLLLVSAPSTAHRVQYYRDVFHAPPLSLGYLVHRSLNVGRLALETSGLVLVIVAGLLVAAVRCAPERWAAFPRKYWGLVLAATVSVAVLILSPYTEPRAFSWWWATLAIVGLRAVAILQAHRRKRMEVAAVALTVAALGFGGWLFGEYATFARAVDERDVAIRGAKATEACRQGLPIALISTTTSPRFLNHREEWVGASLDQMSAYYGCTLTLTPAKPPD